MNDELRRHLDGEIPRSGLDAELRSEAEAWERLLDRFRVEVSGGSPPPWLEQRVMAEIEALPAPGRLHRAVAWLVRPHPVRISPLTAGLAVAALVVVLLLPGGGRTPAPIGSAAPGQDSGQAARGGGPAAASAPNGARATPTVPVVYVQFVLEAPGARSVAVAGDFTGWDASQPLEDPDGDGVWTGRVAVRPGVHSYMFVIDGSKWVTDPHAKRYTADGFGNRNAVLAVAAPSA